MREIPVLGVIAMLLLTNTATYASEAVGGQATFLDYCAACHAPGMEHPGTMRLTLRRGGADGALEARDDLSAEYVMAIVRSGLGLMPAFRPSEIDDVTLVALAAYLSNADPKQ